MSGHPFLDRAANRRGVVAPTFSPKPRKMPRRLASTSRSFDCTSLRAVSSARVSWAILDLQYTDRNQPSRINCAIPRASLRSDFTGIALHAPPTCRVSNSSTARPASRIAAYSHCDSGPASRPIRFRLKPTDLNHAISTSGSLVTLSSGQSSRSHPQRKRSSIPMTRRFLHNGSWSSLDDAWSGRKPDSVALTPSA
jgi:hypothetical protein